jgi:hypothetical protein
VLAQPSPDQAGLGWGTRNFCGELRKAVVSFRKRYPTLSDDETVGKDGAPGFVEDGEPSALVKKETAVSGDGRLFGYDEEVGCVA